MAKNRNIEEIYNNLSDLARIIIVNMLTVMSMMPLMLNGSVQQIQVFFTHNYYNLDRESRYRLF